MTENMTVKKVTTEQAFDMLPYVSDVYTKLDIQGYIEKNKVKAEKGEDTEELMKTVGAKVILHVLKNSSKVKEEFFNIVSIFESKSIEEVKSQSLFATIASVKSLMSDEELMGFFKQSV